MNVNYSENVFMTPLTILIYQMKLKTVYVMFFHFLDFEFPIISQFDIVMTLDAAVL